VNKVTRSIMNSLIKTTLLWMFHYTWNWLKE
jgi:hypothetical protein